jgi:hypothetical protein
MTSCWLVKPKVSNVGKGNEHKNNENNEQKYGDKKTTTLKQKTLKCNSCDWSFRHKVIGR